MDLRDGFLPEPYVGRGDVVVAEADGRGRALAEHHVQLREAEHERIRAVDQRDLDLLADLLGQPSGELEAAEAGTENENGGGHGPRISALR